MSMTDSETGDSSDLEPSVRPRARIVRATTIVLVAIVLALVGSWAVVTIEDRSQTARTTARFEPPVWAGQNFIPG